MKIAGKSLLKRRHGIVTLEREGEDGKPEKIDLVVCAAPCGFMVKMRSIGVLEWPKAPVAVKRDVNGKVLLDSNKVPITEEIDTDPAYRQAMSSVSRRLMALQLRMHLQDDSTVEFDSVQPKTDSKDEWIAYADSLLKEIESVGLTDIEIAEINRRGTELSNSIDSEAAIDSF